MLTPEAQPGIFLREARTSQWKGAGVFIRRFMLSISGTRKLQQTRGHVSGVPSPPFPGLMYIRQANA